MPPVPRVPVRHLLPYALQSHPQRLTSEWRWNHEKGGDLFKIGHTLVYIGWNMDFRINLVNVIQIYVKHKSDFDFENKGENCITYNLK